MKKFARIAVAFLGLLCLAEAIDLAYLHGVRATITTATSSVTIAGNGSVTSFNFSFVAGSTTYIDVTFTDASGNPTVLPPSQYTLTINPVPPGQVWGIGGNVVYPTVASGNPPIAAGTTVTISRSVPLTQSISSNQGQAFPTVVEAALDLLEMQIQQIGNLAARIVVGPVTDPPGLNYTLPAVAQRAGQIFGWDSLGNVIAVSTAPSGVISSAMAPVVSAATLALGRTAFGLGSMALENINGGNCGAGSIQDDGSAGGANGVGYARVVPATVGDATSQSVNCNFHFQQHIATGPITYTLPKASTALFNGFGFWIYALPTGGIVTILPNASDNFVGSASGASIALNPGAWNFITTNAASTATWYVRPAPTGIQPTVTRITASAQCPYATPLGVIRLEGEMAAGGGGGGGNASSGTTGGNGGTSSFGGWIAAGGAGGGAGTTIGGPYGGGGSGGANGTGILVGRWGGAYGTFGFGPTSTATNTSGVVAGSGGAGPYGGQSQGTSGTAAPVGAPSNSGGGGAGAPTSNLTSNGPGGGGGAGEFVRFQINNPAGSISCAVGLGGTSSGGSVGATGVIIIKEYY